MSSRNYVLITPAKDEAKFIGPLAESIVAQTVPPARWIVVSDGSTDGTDEIVQRYAQTHSFIQLVCIPSGQKRSFGSKALAFRRGCDALAGLEFTYIGNLDADMTLEPNYYERLMVAMENDSRLGIATGVCWDKTPTGFQQITISLNHAVGAVQFFRRECFEEIGGYRPVSVGGMDSLAELTARMKGWQTQAFQELPVYHHKPVDSGSGRNARHICYRAGLTEYHIGTHPLFALVKALRRWRQKPVGLCVLFRVAAYAKLWLSGVRRDAPDELVAYVRTEQLGRLRGFWGRGKSEFGG